MFKKIEPKHILNIMIIFIMFAGFIGCTDSEPVKPVVTINNMVAYDNEVFLDLDIEDNQSIDVFSIKIYFYDITDEIEYELYLGSYIPNNLEYVFSFYNSEHLYTLKIQVKFIFDEEIYEELYEFDVLEDLEGTLPLLYFDNVNILNSTIEADIINEVDNLVIANLNYSVELYNIDGDFYITLAHNYYTNFIYNKLLANTNYQIQLIASYTNEVGEVCDVVIDEYTFITD